MKNFVGYIKNDRFEIGCTGQTVYVYDKGGNELAKFKDLKYAYKSFISPKGDIFVVKSGEGCMAVYSLDPIRLITKFRFAKKDDPQDYNCCFSQDGSLFYSVDYTYQDGFVSYLSIYDTKEFVLKKRIFGKEQNIHPLRLERDPQTGKIYILFKSLLPHISHLARDRFVALLSEEVIQDRILITEDEEDFYYWCGVLSDEGFTKFSKRFSGLSKYDIDLEHMEEDKKYTLSYLWTKKMKGETVEIPKNKLIMQAF